MLTVKPRLSRRQPMEEAATPLPSEETTPPVTNIYFGAIRIARVVTRFTTPDCSYLAGETMFKTISARRRKGFRVSGFVLTNPEINKLYLPTLISNDVRTIMGKLRRSVNSKSSRRGIENFYRRATFPQQPGSGLPNDTGFRAARSTAYVQ